MTNTEFRAEVERLVALWFSAASPSVAGVDSQPVWPSLKSARVAGTADFEQTASPPGCRSITSGPAESSAAAHVTGPGVLLLVRDTALVMQDESGIDRAS